MSRPRQFNETHVLPTLSFEYGIAVETETRVDQILLRLHWAPQHLDTVLLRQKPASLGAKSGEISSFAHVVWQRDRILVTGCECSASTIARVHVSAVEERLEALLEIVDHVITGRRLRHLDEPFNAGDRVLSPTVQTIYRQPIQARTCIIELSLKTGSLSSPPRTICGSMFGAQVVSLLVDYTAAVPAVFAAPALVDEHTTQSAMAHVAPALVVEHSATDATVQANLARRPCA